MTTTSIHNSQFPLKFPMSKNIMLSIKKTGNGHSINDATVIAKYLNNPSSVSCYTDNKFSYSLQN